LIAHIGFNANCSIPASVNLNGIENPVRCTGTAVTPTWIDGKIYGLAP
jgi:hypothetical protein